MKLFDKPFRYGVWDELFTNFELQMILDVWPLYESNTWETHACGKKSMRRFLPAPVRDVMSVLSSAMTRRCIGLDMGVSDLQWDTTLFGGGLHWMPVGTKLDMHIDFNQNKEGFYRRVNVFLFLNRHWKPEHKGELVLGNGQLCPPARIAPLFNRLVVFRYGENAWHGVPETITADRKSIACYYYTKDKPEDFTTAHSTIYEQKP